MNRRLLNLLTAPRTLLVVFWIGLVPFVCVVAGWVGSAASSVDLPLWKYQGRTTSVYVSSTAFRAIEVAIVTNPVIERDTGYFYLRRNPAILGTYFGAVANPNATRTFVMLFPYWLLFAISAAWPGTFWWRHVAARRLRDWKRRNRICVRCGYDLRATPSECPECGTIAEAPG